MSGLYPDFDVVRSMDGSPSYSQLIEQESRKPEKNFIEEINRP